jgi:hypothetical protein
MYPQVQRAVAAILSGGKVVTPVDVIVRLAPCAFEVVAHHCPSQCRYASIHSLPAGFGDGNGRSTREIA